MTRVKICGCMRVEDALAAKEAGADFVGLVFATSSSRRLSIEDGQAIAGALGPGLRDLEQAGPPPARQAAEGGDVAEWFRHGADALERLLAAKRPITVGVFEDQPLEEVNTVADECGLDLVQLSGHESWADCLLVNRQVVKGVEASAGVAAEEVVEGMDMGSAIACLLDISRGKGIAVERETAARVAGLLPVWLAGGLTPDNVSETVRDVRPWAVDVSSGVETGGQKDAEKIRAFIAAAKGSVRV